MRKPYLDRIRWATILCVVVFHVLYIFNGETPAGVIGPFKPVQYQDALQYLLYPWMMILLFLVAGMCSRYYLERHTIKEFVSARTAKLLVPSTIGLFVFGWIQGYYNMQISGAFEKVDVPKLLLYPIMAISGTGVLWFIQMLWLFSMLLALIRKHETGKLYDFCGKTNVWAALALVLPIYGASFLLNTPIIVAYRFGLYGLSFFLGYFVFAHEDVIARLSMRVGYLIAAATVAGGVYTYLHFGENYAENPTFNSVSAMVFAWLACLAILAGFYRWGNAASPLSDWMTKRSFGLYVLHYLPLSASAYYLTKYAALPPILVYIIVLVCGLVGGLLLNAVISRIPFLRWSVLGMKKTL